MCSDQLTTKRSAGLVDAAAIKSLDERFRQTIGCFQDIVADRKKEREEDRKQILECPPNYCKTFIRQLPDVQRTRLNRLNARQLSDACIDATETNVLDNDFYVYVSGNHGLVKVSDQSASNHSGEGASQFAPTFNGRS